MTIVRIRRCAFVFVVLKTKFTIKSCRHILNPVSIKIKHNLCVNSLIHVAVAKRKSLIKFNPEGFKPTFLFNVKPQAYTL